MKRGLSILLLFICFVLGGCSGSGQKGEVLAKINNYEITKEEFEQEFREFRGTGADTLEARKEFLNNLIYRKLVLQDAQQKGLDKEKDFLRRIEKFWEQSLLKLALDKKTKEIPVKGEITRSKEAQEMDDWISQLHKKAQISINEELLK